MSTGYTYMLKERDLSLAEFAFICASVGDDVLRKIDDMISQYQMIVDRDQKELDNFLALSHDEKEQLLKEEHDRRVAIAEKQRADMIILKNRYESMIEKVKKWSVPSELDHIKKFMLQQLQSSLRWDCSHHDDEFFKIEPITPDVQELVLKEELTLSKKSLSNHICERKKIEALKSTLEIFLPQKPQILDLSTICQNCDSLRTKTNCKC